MLFFFFIFFSGYIAAGTLLLFAIIRTLHGIPFGTLTVANSTVAIDVLPASRRNEGIGYFGLSNNLAMAIAPSAGIFLYKFSSDFTLLFWLSFIIAGIGMFVDSTVNLQQKEIMRNSNKISLDRFFLTRAWLLGVNIAFFSFCYGVLSNYLAIYSKEVMGITGGTGSYFMLLSIGLFVSRLQGARALRAGKLTQNAAEGVCISVIGYLIFVLFPNSIGYYLSAILIGLGNGHMYPAFLNMFIHTAHHNERGTANSSILISWDAGFGIGILAGGIVSEILGYNAAFWMVFAVNATGVIIYLAFTQKFFHKKEIKEL
jgi:Arabinose efflux permease